MKAERVLPHFRTECVAVRREVILNLHARVRKERQRGGVREVAPIGSEELLDLRPLEGDVLDTGVHIIDDNDDLDRRLAPADRLKGRDGLRNFVVHHSEVLLLETADRRP